MRLRSNNTLNVNQSLYDSLNTSISISETETDSSDMDEELRMLITDHPMFIKYK
jgi:hypothetical protein